MRDRLGSLNQLVSLSNGLALVSNTLELDSCLNPIHQWGERSLPYKDENSAVIRGK